MRDTTDISVSREAFLSLASNVVMSGIGFGSTIVLARGLGPDGLGVYQTALAAAFVAVQFTGGVGTAVQKRVSEVDVEPGEFLGAGLLAHAVVTVAVLLGFLALEGWVSDYFESRAMALAVVAIVGSLGLFQVVNRTYAGVGYPGMSSWMDTARSVVTLAFQVVFLVLGFQAFGVAVGLVVGTALTAAASWLVAGVRPAVPSRATVERVYDFARWSVPNGLLSNAYSSADVLIIKAVTGSTAVGYYTVANHLVMPAILLASSIRGALSVRSSGVVSAGGDPTEDLTNSLMFAGLFAIPMFFGALAFPTALVRTLYTGDFSGATTPLVLMAAFALVKVYGMPFEAAFEGLDRPNTIFRVNAVVIVVHLPLAVVLGYAEGLLGVIAATVFAELVRVGIYLLLVRREFGPTFALRPPAEQLASALLMFAVVRTIADTVGLDGWLPVSATILVGAGIYFAVLVVISPNFRLVVRNAFLDDLLATLDSQ